MATQLQVHRVEAPHAEPRMAPAAQRSAMIWPRFLPAACSGALLYACFFPLAWGWLAWFALAPLLCLVRAQARARNIYFAAWLGGVIFFLPALYWVSVADYRMVYAWIALAMYCALYWVAAIFLLRRLDRSTTLPLVLTVPVVWTALEFLRSFLISGFAWYFLGHSQHAYLAVIQIADVTGVYGITFLIAAVNAWLFDGLYRLAWFRGVFQLDEAKAHGAGRTRTAQIILILAAVVLTCGYGLWRLEQADFAPGPRIAVLQGNLDQRLRNRANSDHQAQLSVNQHYGRLEELALAQRPDLVIWPETSYPLEWYDFTGPQRPDRLQIVQDEILEPVRLSRVNHLLGMNAKIFNAQKERTLYNIALLVKANGDASQRYDKIHRLPFGEYVPLRDVLPFLNHFAPYDYDYSISMGEKYTRFKLDKYHFGVFICFEATDPALARQYHTPGADGPPVDFLVNMGNDGWFDGSSEHEEHLAISRFRAIECRRAVVRSVNMGISAVIDSNGRVQEPRLVAGSSGEVKNWVIAAQNGQVPDLPESRWGEFKKVTGVLTATVPIDRRASFYAQWGDWLPWLCWLIVVGGLAWAIVQRRRARPAVALGTTSVVGPVRIAAAEPTIHGKT